MKKMKIETSTDALDIAYRVHGLAKAANLLMNPAFSNPEDVEIQFAARMAIEAAEDYADAIIHALDRAGIQEAINESLRKAKRDDA
jgi:hypothetical protein